VQVALGFKAHSGWAALVAVGESGRDLEVIERRRVELTDEGQLWAKQPYHAAEDLEPNEAREVVKSGIASARRVARMRLHETIKRIQKHGNRVMGCGVMVPEPMLEWSIDEILAVHFRMHKAEGVLFPDALCRAAEAAKLATHPIPEKRLESFVEQTLGSPLDVLTQAAAGLGKTIGPPWGKDQKWAAMAAIFALRVLKPK
jgi:hypothetical protein